MIFSKISSLTPQSIPKINISHIYDKAVRNQFEVLFDLEFEAIFERELINFKAISIENIVPNSYTVTNRGYDYLKNLWAVFKTKRHSSSFFNLFKDLARTSYNKSYDKFNHNVKALIDKEWALLKIATENVKLQKETEKKQREDAAEIKRKQDIIEKQQKEAADIQRQQEIKDKKAAADRANLELQLRENTREAGGQQVINTLLFKGGDKITDGCNIQ